jgi:hypothetical protein
MSLAPSGRLASGASLSTNSTLIDAVVSTDALLWGWLKNMYVPAYPNTAP